MRRSIVGKLGDSKQDVLDQLTKLQHKKVTQRLADPSQLTTEEFLEQWLTVGAGTSVAATTLMSYRRNLATHVFPVVGTIRVQKLTPLHIQNVIAGMRKHTREIGAKPKDRSCPRSKQYVFSILRRAFKRGLEWGILERNPCDGVERPKNPRHEIRPLNAEQAKTFLEAAVGSNVYGLFVLAIQTGARQGELRALRWSDTNLKDGTISIRRTISDTPEGEIEKAPKTPKGNRLVNLPQLSRDVLLDLRREAVKRRWDNAGRVFQLDYDGAVRRCWLSRELLRILKKGNLPRIRFHDLRHTHATLLLLQDVHPKIVQERLGHANIAITLDTYSHVLPSMQGEIPGKLDQLFA